MKSIQKPEDWFWPPFFTLCFQTQNLLGACVTYEKKQQPQNSAKPLNTLNGVSLISFMLGRLEAQTL